MLDLIYLDYSCEPPFPHFIDWYNDKSKLDPVFEPFRRIYWLCLEVGIDDAISYLTDVKDLNLFINSIVLFPYDSEESELLSNPEFFKKGVRSICVEI